MPVVLLLAAVISFSVAIGGFLLIGREGAPLRPFAGAPQDQLGPVILVPGYGGTTGSLRRLAARIESTGRQAEVFELPGDGTGDLRTQARKLSEFVKKVRGASPSVDVIGYSAGGVVTRLWIHDFGGRKLARRVVTMGSPHHGTKLAGLARTFASSDCPDACQQLVPGSSLLRKLNRGDETPSGPRWISLWSTADDVVTPADSARLEGAIDIELQSVCADETVQHSGLPVAPLVVGIVLDSIGLAPPPGKLSRADCAELRATGAMPSTR
jgi:pimeloyl-ACP methyl ester carboxylesterase